MNDEIPAVEPVALSPADTAGTKRRVRAEVRAGRAAMSEADRSRARDALTARLVELVESHGATRVTCYTPVHGEPDTTGFLAWAREKSVEVLLPISLAERRIAWALLDDEPMRSGRHGIPEPAGEVLPEEAAADTDLMFIPACSVDGRGTRLGWGLGYYDRCLERVRQDVVSRSAGQATAGFGSTVGPVVYALVFDADIRPLLPREPHDLPVDGVITPSATLDFTG